MVVAQHTNLSSRIAASIFQMKLSMGCHFLYLKQDLSQVKTMEHSGTVKVNSTSTKRQFCPMDMPRMDFLILSTHSILPSRLKPAKTIAGARFQVPQGASGPQNSQLR